MKILVTGATGFIGGRIAEAVLAQNKYELVISGRSAPKNDSLLKQGAVFLRGDLGDKKYAEAITRGVDTIIHCAGLAGTWGPYEDYYLANVLSTETLLKSAKENGVRRLINLSSPSIYFDYKNQLNLKESDLPKKFSNHYARTKYESELIVSEFQNKGVETISLRPRSVVGAGDANTLPRLIRLQQAGQLKQIGDGKNIVDTTAIGNLIDAIFLCIHCPREATGEIYNISDGAPIRFWNFVDLVFQELGLATQRQRLPYALVMTIARINEALQKLRRSSKEPTLIPLSVGVISLSMTMDISKARSRLGYKPRFTTEDGIKEFARWWLAKKENR